MSYYEIVIDYIISCMVILSICFLILINILLSEKKTNSSKLIHYICLSETMMLFSEFLIIKKNSEIEKFTYNGLNYMLFGLFEKGDEKQMISINKVINVIYSINLTIYFSMQNFSLMCNCFICFETIISLINPISIVRKRLNYYKSIIIISTLSIMTIIINHEFRYQGVDSKSVYYRLFHLTSAVIINLVIFIVYLIIGVISFFYLISRFCSRNNSRGKLRNRFVINHFCYYMINFLILTPFYVSSLVFTFSPNNENDTEKRKFMDISIIIHLSVGFTMFFVRLPEISSNWKLAFRKFFRISDNLEMEVYHIVDPDQPLTAIINKTLNLEFICCILNGLSQISQQKNKKILFRSSEELNVTMSKVLQSTQLNRRESKKTNVLSDFKRIKPHKIYYSSYFDTSNPNEIKMKVKRSGNKDDTTFDIENTNLNDLSIKDKKKHDAIILEHCPKVFSLIRSMDEIPEIELEYSFNPDYNTDIIERMKESEGKSGSFFFYTHDNKFLIKTVTNNELETLLEGFIENYYDHLNLNRKTLLAKIYGIYTVIINKVSKLNVILMQNLNNFPIKYLKRIYDLKGSRIERFTKNIQKCDKSKTLKDLDYIWMIQVDTELISFEKENIELLNLALKEDLVFLKNSNIMDYSIMLIILNHPDSEEPGYEKIINIINGPRSTYKNFLSRNKKYIYCIGIIDYLQQFTMTKFFENKYKRLLYGNDIKFVSAVDPTSYSIRMHKFAKEYIFI